MFALDHLLRRWLRSFVSLAPLSSSKTASASPPPPLPPSPPSPPLAAWLWLAGVLFFLTLLLSIGAVWLSIRSIQQTPAIQRAPYDGLARSLLQGGSAPVSDPKLCQSLRDGDFHGDFREVDCLITFRRAFPKRGIALEERITEKMRALHERLRRQSNDWRTAAKWKLLYLIGTKMYPVENTWAENAEIPVYEVNGHHMALPFWIKEALRRDVGPLFHLDTHNDMRAIPTPREVQKAVEDLKAGRKTREAWHTIAHAVYDCAMPVAGGVLTAEYTDVIWGKPSWNGYQDFVQRTFFFARPLASVPVAVLAPSEKNDDRKKKDLASMEKKRSNYRLYYDPLLDKQQPAVRRADAWVTLDETQRPIPKKFEMITPFKLTILTTDKPLDAKGQGEGANEFQQLLKALPKGIFTLDLDLDYFASIDSTKEFKRKAGSDPEWQLDLFQKRRNFLKERVARFRNLLIALRDQGRIPALITIADSTYLTFAFDEVGEGQSEYTPIEHTAYLREAVRDIFREVYGDRVVGRGRPPAKPTTPPRLRPSSSKKPLLLGDERKLVKQERQE